MAIRTICDLPEDVIKGQLLPYLSQGEQRAVRLAGPWGRAAFDDVWHQFQAADCDMARFLGTDNDPATEMRFLQKYRERITRLRPGQAHAFPQNYRRIREICPYLTHLEIPKCYSSVSCFRELQEPRWQSLETVCLLDRNYSPQELLSAPDALTHKIEAVDVLVDAVSLEQVLTKTNEMPKLMRLGIIFPDSQLFIHCPNQLHERITKVKVDARIQSKEELLQVLARANAIPNLKSLEISIENNEVFDDVFTDIRRVCVDILGQTTFVLTRPDQRTYTIERGDVTEINLFSETLSFEELKNSIKATELAKVTKLKIRLNSDETCEELTSFLRDHCPKLRELKLEAFSRANISNLPPRVTQLVSDSSVRAIRLTGASALRELRLISSCERHPKIIDVPRQVRIERLRITECQQCASERERKLLLLALGIMGYAYFMATKMVGRS